MTTARLVLELGPDTTFTFGSGVFGAGLFGAGSGEGSGEVTRWVSVQIQRGLTPEGAVEKLEPGLCRVALKGAEFNPLTFEHTRPGRPLRVLVEVDDDGDITRTDVFTGTIDKAPLTVGKDGTVRVTLTALDAVSPLASAPYELAHAGTLAQRVTPLLEAAGLAYVVHDDNPDLTPGLLPTNERNVLGGLTLARDTMHGYFFVDRSNVVQVYDDRQRSRTPADLVLTDGTVAGLSYVDIDLGFDTDDLINVLTIETLTDTDPVLETFVDEDSADEWRPVSQTITVNDGDAATHANRFRARLAGASLSAKQVTLNVGKLDALATIAGLELYDSVRVVHAGAGIDQEQQVIRLEHIITADRTHGIRWIANLGTRRRELLPLRWSDVPAGLRWSDVPAGMTWDDSIFWHPA